MWTFSDLGATQQNGALSRKADIHRDTLLHQVYKVDCPGTGQKNTRAICVLFSLDITDNDAIVYPHLVWRRCVVVLNQLCNGGKRQASA